MSTFYTIPNGQDSSEVLQDWSRVVVEVRRIWIKKHSHTHVFLETFVEALESILYGLFKVLYIPLYTHMAVVFNSDQRFIYLFIF